MRPRQIRRLYTLMASGAILAGSVIGTGIARATPDVCTALNASPTVGTVEQLVVGFMGDGLTPGDAGELIAVAVMAQCPQFKPVLERFVASYTGAGTVRT